MSGLVQLWPALAAQEVTLEDVEKLMEEGQSAKDYEDRCGIAPSCLVIRPSSQLQPVWAFRALIWHGK